MDLLAQRADRARRDPARAELPDRDLRPEQRLDLPGLAIITAGLFSLVYGLVRGNELGWDDPQIVAALALGVVGILAFIGWEARTAEPMLPLRLFRSRTFSAANGVSLLMYFGMFGSIFLLAQFFQVVQHYSPFQAGLRTLPWTIMPIFVAPTAGILSARTGTRPLIVLGMALQAGRPWRGCRPSSRRPSTTP